MPSPKRQLYQCLNAKVLYKDIYCKKGHAVSKDIISLIRGDPMEMTVCQKCLDYDEMGPPIPKEQRGWMWIA